MALRVAIGWPSESGRDAAVSPRQSHSVPPLQAMIWIGAASAPSCGLGGFRGRQRSAISPSAWDGRLRRAAQAWPGLSVRSERDTCGRVRRVAESCRTAAARSGIFGWKIRDPSCLPSDGRRNPTNARPSLRGEAVRVQRCEMRAAATARAFRALGIFPHFMHCSLVRSQNNRKGFSWYTIVRSQKHLYALKTTLVRTQNNKTCRCAQAQPLDF